MAVCHVSAAGDGRVLCIVLVSTYTFPITRWSERNVSAVLTSDQKINSFPKMERAILTFWRNRGEKLAGREISQVCDVDEGAHSNRLPPTHRTRPLGGGYEKGHEKRGADDQRQSQSFGSVEPEGISDVDDQYSRKWRKGAAKGLPRTKTKGFPRTNGNGSILCITFRHLFSPSHLRFGWQWYMRLGREAIAVVLGLSSYAP